MAFVYVCIFVVLFVLYKVLHLNQTPEKPRIYGRDVRFVDYLVKSCPILTYGYIPTALWGRSGHVQTIVHSFIGRVHVPRSEGERVFATLSDGALVSFDLYPPYRAHHTGKDLTIAICPGICNSSDTIYIQAFIHNALRRGFRCAVLNHIGTLPSVPLKTARIFSYGGTVEFEIMVREILRRCHQTQVICLGFSMGANIVTRFLTMPFMDQIIKPDAAAKPTSPASDSDKGFEESVKEEIDEMAGGDSTPPKRKEESSEKSLVETEGDSGVAELGKDRPEKISCVPVDPEEVDSTRVIAGISICQGYDVITTGNLLRQWDNWRRVYSYVMTVGMQKLISCNKSILLSEDVKQRLGIDEKQVFSASSLSAFDDAYTRKVCGYETIEEMYRSISSLYILKKIKRPIVFINAADDPIVPEQLLEKIRGHVEKSNRCMYVETLHGGHLAFFEGGIVIPRKYGWLDRVALQLSDSLALFTDSPSLPIPSASVPLPSPSPAPRVRRRLNAGSRSEAQVAMGVPLVAVGGAMIDDEDDDFEDVEEDVQLPARRPPFSLKQLSSLAV